MQYYSKKTEVDVHDVDYNGVCRTSALMKYIQAAAQSQLTDGGMSYDQLKERRRAFILSRIKMEFTATVRAYDVLNAISFPCDSRGYSFLRCYKLERGGETIGRAVSIWALIDTDTHALVKVNDFELGLKTYAPLDLSLSRIVLPSEMAQVGKYLVTYGITDQNRHMNNTTYPDMYSTFLPLESKRIEEITINYANEAPMGELLTVFHGVSGDYHYFRTVRADGKTNTEAEIRLTDI